MPRRKKDGEIPTILVIIGGILLLIEGVIYVVGYIISEFWHYLLILGGVGLVVYFFYLLKNKKLKVSGDGLLNNNSQMDFLNPKDLFFKFSFEEFENYSIYYSVGLGKTPAIFHPTINEHFSSGNFVNQGEEIFSLSFDDNALIGYQRKIRVGLPAATSGYIEFLVDQFSIGYLIEQQIKENKEKQYLFILYKDNSVRLKERYSNTVIIEEDEITGEKILFFGKIGYPQLNLAHYFSEKYFSYTLSNGSPITPCEGNFYFFRFIKIYLGFEFSVENLNGEDYLVIIFNAKAQKLASDDSISFLFENKELIMFKIIGKPFTLIKDYKKGFRLPIYQEDIECFISNNIKKIRIHFLKENYFEEFESCSIAKGKEDFQYLLKALFTQYTKEVEKNITDYKPLSRKNITSFEPKTRDDSCFVYLMVDLVNNYHKIGISNKPDYREKTLQSEKPTIELIARKKYPSRKIAESIERALHNTYSDKNVRGEWFNLSAGDVNEVVETLK